MSIFMPKRELMKYLLFIILFYISCTPFNLKLRKADIEFYRIYPSEYSGQTNNYKQILMEPYILVISETNRVKFSEKDISNITLFTNEGMIYFSFIFKPRVRDKLFEFTLKNMNSLVAIVINGEARNIGFISEPIRNCKMEFSTKTKNLHDIIKFLNLLINLPDT